MISKLGVEVLVKVGLQQLFRLGSWESGWSVKTKVIINSAQFKLKLKFEIGNIKVRIRIRSLLD